MQTLSVEYSGVIRRPSDIVRTHFTDFAHHIRTGVHKGIDYSVLADDGRTRRVRQEVTLVGMRQIDEFIQSWQADGTLLNDFVNGTNVGMRLRLWFAPAAESATSVRVRVEVPLRGVKKLLKPLFRIALRKTIAKALEEDRVDMEERGYSPA